MPLVKPDDDGPRKVFHHGAHAVTPGARGEPPPSWSHKQAVDPCLAMIPATTTTKAPVGPPICVFEPPSAEIRKPVTMAQYRPACGDTPEAIANAIARGKATRPTVTPANKVGQKFMAIVAAQAGVSISGAKLRQRVS